MPNPYLMKRSLQLFGHKTSVALEQEFWDVLEEMAVHKEQNLMALIAEIDTNRHPEHSLSSALRLASIRFLQQYYRQPDHHSPKIS